MSVMEGVPPFRLLAVNKSWLMTCGYDTAAEVIGKTLAIL